MRYFYGGLDPEVYRAAVLPGGGRGALRLVGEYHRECVRAEVEAFPRDHLAACRERLAELKTELAIPDSSSDEIEAAVQQSRLRALAPAHWKPSETAATHRGYVARTFTYRLADLATRVARAHLAGLDKRRLRQPHRPARRRCSRRTLAQRRFWRAARPPRGQGGRAGAGPRPQAAPALLAPVQAMLRATQHAAQNVKGEVDPVAIGEIEAMLQVLERGHLLPDADPARDVLDLPGCLCRKRTSRRLAPCASPLNERYEMDPEALLARSRSCATCFAAFPRSSGSFAARCWW